MDDLETRLRSAFRARAANAPRELNRDLPTQSGRPSYTTRSRAPRRFAPIAVVAAVLAIVATTVIVVRLQSDSDGPAGWSSNGITLNTSSWEPDDDSDAAGVFGIVRVDPNGCVYLGSKGSDQGVDIVWPAGYTAARQPDGTVAILNPDGAVVADTGHRIRARGGEAPSDVEFACRAQNTDGNTPFAIEDELPPLGR